ncbi:UNVERIFIED_CONTAM: glc-1 [Trichonephila clavipes]
MSFITFWIPAEAYPARVTLSVTSLLTIVTQQYQSAMPSVSYVVALNIWMLSCIGFVFCSLLEYAFVIAVMNNKGTDLWPFKKLKRTIHGYVFVNTGIKILFFLKVLHHLLFDISNGFEISWMETKTVKIKKDPLLVGEEFLNEAIRKSQIQSCQN